MSNIVKKIETHFLQKRYQDVLTLIDKEAPNTESIELLYYKGLALKLLNRYEAEDVFRSILEKEPQHVFSMLPLSEILSDQGKTNEAISLIENAIKLAPNYADSYFQLGLLKFKRNQFEEALIHFEAAMSRSARNAIYITLKARALLELKRFEESKNSFIEALKIDPNNIEARYFFAELSMLIGDGESVIENLNHVIRLNPTHELALRMLSLMYLNVGKYTNALPLLKTLLKIDPQNMDYQFRYGMCIFQLGKYEDAIKIFGSLFKKNQTDIIPLCYIGLSYAKLDQIPKAIEMLKKAVSIDSTHFLPYQFLATIYGMKEKYDKALSMYLKALSINENDPELMMSIGMCYMELKDSKKACNYFKKAVEINPINPNYMLVLGNVYIENGDIEAAKAVYEKCVAMHPTLREPKEALLRLKHLH